MSNFIVVHLGLGNRECLLNIEHITFISEKDDNVSIFIQGDETPIYVNDSYAEIKSELQEKGFLI